MPHRPRALPLFFALTCLGLSLAAGPVQACDSATCLLITRGQNGVLPKGALRFDFSFRQTDQTLLLRGSEEVGQVFRPKVDFENGRVRPGYHDELGGRERFLQVDAAYGLGARTSLLASFPFLAHRAFDIGHPPVLRERYTTTGNGDVLLGVRHALKTSPRGSLVGGVSLKVPTGRYRIVSPARAADFGILDPTLQPGSGSVDVVGSLQYTWNMAGFGWGFSGSYQANAKNELGYRFGDDAIVSLTMSRALTKRLSPSLQLKAFHKGRSTFLGEEVLSSGSRIVYVLPGLSVNLWKKVSVYGYAPIPVYRYVNEAQLAPRPSFVLGASKTLYF